jgi:hypothetical protein
MTHLTTILILICSSFFCCGQPISDKQEIVQQCIDLELLQLYYHETEVEGRIPLVILDNGIIPADLKLTKFGQSVLFMRKEDIFNKNIKAFLSFDEFIITTNSAKIRFRYDIEGVRVNVEMEKKDSKWIIKTSDLFEV